MYAIAKPDDFGEGALLLRPGRPGRRVYFIESGILQVFKETGKGISIDYLLTKHDLCVAPDSFVSGDPTNYFIAALADTKTLSTTYDDLKAVMDAHPELRDCVFAIIEQYRKDLGWRYSDMLDMGVRERVDWFRKKYPGLIGYLNDETIWTFLKLNRDAYYDGKNGDYKQKP